MGSNLRLYWDHVGRVSAPLVASAEDAAFPASNLETGNIRRFWKGTSTSEHTLMWDAGSGLTLSVDTVVLAYAALLVAVTANVALQYSDDAAAWSDVWTKTPLTTGDLSKPDALHYAKEEAAALTHRAFRIRIYGSMTDVPALSGGIFLGLRTELPIQPTYGRTVSSDRAYRGRDIALSWPPMTATQAESFGSAIASITPDVTDGPQETVAGVVYGGVPHWLADPVGTVLCRESSTVPYLFPVTCVSPDGTGSASVAPQLERPGDLRWRVRR